jgi:hypothetical protein
MQETPEERESRMRDLAQKLMFTVEKTNGRYSLIRTADVSRPVREMGLTLTEAEELLETCAARSGKASRDCGRALRQSPRPIRNFFPAAGAHRVPRIKSRRDPTRLSARARSKQRNRG